MEDNYLEKISEDSKKRYDRAKKYLKEAFRRPFERLINATRMEKMQTITQVCSFIQRMAEIINDDRILSKLIVKNLVDDLLATAKSGDNYDLHKQKIALINTVDKAIDDYPMEIEEAIGRVLVLEKKGKYKVLNRLLVCEIEGSILHLHVMPAMTLSFVTKKQLMQDGFQRLVDILNNDEKIKIISATSPLVKRHQRFFESLGFVKQNKKLTENSSAWLGFLGNQVSKTNFSDDESATATIGRESFLNKFAIKMKY